LVAAATLAATAASVVVVTQLPAQAGDTKYPNGISSTVTPSMTSYTQRNQTVSSCLGNTTVRDWTVSWNFANVSGSGLTIKDLTLSISHRSGPMSDMVVGSRYLSPGGPDFGGSNVIYGNSGFTKSFDVSPDKYYSGIVAFKVNYEEIFSTCSTGEIYGFTFELVPQGGSAWDTTSSRRIANVANGQCLLVQGGAEGNPVVPYTCLSYADQYWTLLSSGGGYYQVRNSNSGKCLTAPSWNGRNVIQYSCGNAFDQQWYISTGSTQSRLQLRDNGLCLTAPSWAPGDVVLVGCDVYLDQFWRQN
jgi:hypothetical protein